MHLGPKPIRPPTRQRPFASQGLESSCPQMAQDHPGHVAHRHPLQRGCLPSKPGAIFVEESGTRNIISIFSMMELDIDRLKGSSRTCAAAGPDDPYRVDFSRGDGSPVAALRLPPAMLEQASGL